MNKFEERYRQANMPTTNNDTLSKEDGQAIEDEEGFRLPGTVITGSLVVADRFNQDENATEVTAPTGVDTIDLIGEPKKTRNDGLSSPNIGSLSTMIEPASRHIHTAHCGFPDCPDAEGFTDYTEEDGQYIPKKNIDHFTLVAGDLAEEPEVNQEDIIKEAPKKPDTVLASTSDYIDLFQKTSSDSELYYKGYMDGIDGKTLDEDLALLSDDYFHGYDQAKYYHQPAQVSAEQKLFDIKPNSNNIPRKPIMQTDADRGPNELTDGTNRATAGKGLPIDVVLKFLEN